MRISQGQSTPRRALAPPRPPSAIKVDLQLSDVSQEDEQRRNAFQISFENSKWVAVVAYCCYYLLVGVMSSLERMILARNTMNDKSVHLGWSKSWPHERPIIL